jgi:hypothetical protein
MTVVQNVTGSFRSDQDVWGCGSSVVREALIITLQFDLRHRPYGSYDACINSYLMTNIQKESRQTTNPPYLGSIQTGKMQIRDLLINLL